VHLGLDMMVMLATLCNEYLHGRGYIDIQTTITTCMPKIS